MRDRALDTGEPAGRDPSGARLLRDSVGAFAAAAWLRQQFTLELDLAQDLRYALLAPAPAVAAAACLGAARRATRLDPVTVLHAE